MLTVSIKDQAKYFKQVTLDAEGLAALERIQKEGLPGFAGRKEYNEAVAAGNTVPVLCLVENVGCNCQISDIITLTDEAGNAKAVLSITDKWLDKGEKSPILFGGTITTL